LKELKKITKSKIRAMTMNKKTLESGKEYTLSDLFSGNNKIIIPDLQRDYCWGNKTWDKNEKEQPELVSCFIDNLLSGFSEYSKKNDDEKKQHKLTLGLIYGYESPKNHIQLCDGQQRITTLFLLLGMLNRLSEKKFKKLLISEKELKHDDKEPYLQYSIRESTLYFLSDLVCEFFLEKEVKLEDINSSNWYFSEYDQDASIQSMLAAIKTIEKKLSQEIDHEGFGNFIAHNLQMLYYDMGDRTRGEETFVVINTTGEPLSATENLKPILIGNIENNEDRKKFSKEWEDREEWFWRNRDAKEHTADDSLNDFFVWYWQIRLLQEQRWIDKKSYELNPKELFTRKPEINAENEENPETGKWEESIKPETIHAYFCSLKELVEQCQDKRIKNVLNTIKDGEITLNWFRGLPKEKSLYVVLPLIAYCKKFQKPTHLYEFVRRIRKNYFDKEWKDRTNNFVDWRHIVQIIEISEKEVEVDVLKFKTLENRDKFNAISNVTLVEWFNEDEQKKDALKEKDKQKIEDWEDHPDFMGDLSFLFSIKENPTITELEKYYQNYVSTVDLVREESIDQPQLVNLFRLFYLFIGCNKVGHMSRVTWEAEGVLFSNLNRKHLFNNEFKSLIASDNILHFLETYVKGKVKEWNLFNLTEENFTTDKAIKLWLTLKVFNANKEGVTLAFYDGNNTGVAVYSKVCKNKLIESEPFSIENFMCGFGVKAGGGSSYIHYTGEGNWNKPFIIDTPFKSIALKKEERTLEQIQENKEKIDEIIKNYQ